MSCGSDMRFHGGRCRYFLLSVVTKVDVNLDARDAGLLQQRKREGQRPLSGKGMKKLPVQPHQTSSIFLLFCEMLVRRSILISE